MELFYTFEKESMFKRIKNFDVKSWNAETFSWLCYKRASYEKELETLRGPHKMRCTYVGPVCFSLSVSAISKIKVGFVAIRM